LTTDTGKKSVFDSINEDYAGGEDPFKREEMRKILRIKKVSVDPLPNAWLERRQVDITHPDFRSAYPEGVPGLHVVAEGVSVFYEPDNTYELWVPIMGIKPEQYGRRLTRRSQIHYTTEAFKSAFGFPPFGAENQKRLEGKVAMWGQQLGSMEADGETREWGWDIPRQAYPDDYKFEGTPQVIKLRAAEGAAVAASSTVVELSDTDADAAVVAAVTGLEPTDEPTAAERVKNIPGITSKWIEQALENKVMETAYANGLIVLDEDKKVIAAPAAA
jgi:hypothetical protein